MKTGKNPKKKIEAFAGFAANGSILFAPIKAPREDAQATLERFNPRLEGVGYGFQVMPVRKYKVLFKRLIEGKDRDF
jgi:hypothetical protein